MSNSLLEILNKVKEKSNVVVDNNKYNDDDDKYVDSTFDFITSFNTCDYISSSNYCFHSNNIDEDGEKYQCPYVENKSFFLCSLSENNLCQNN